MLDPRQLRVQQLLDQNRYLEAEKELRNLLATDPTNLEWRAMMAIALAGSKQLKEAESTIQSCIAEAPDDPWFISMYGEILLLKNQFGKAETIARRAIEMDPIDASHRALLAQALLAQKQLEPALEAANSGLAIDPEDLNCLNLRSTILVTLGRKEEGFATMDKALEQDPDNSHTHANYGWNQLHRGDHRKALEHFREALRHDPESEYAKAGLVEALQARYLVYRWFLKYYFWISNMQSGLQWAVIIGFYLVQRLVAFVAKNSPNLQPFLLPILILFYAFAISTWIIQPLFNLFLRLNPYGRYALSRKQILSSNFLGASLILGLVAGTFFLITNLSTWGFATLFFFLMMLPLGTMLNPEHPARQKVLIGMAILIFLLGMGGLAIGFIEGEGFNAYSSVSLLGIFIYSWIANWAASTA